MCLSDQVSTPIYKEGFYQVTINMVSSFCNRMKEVLNMAYMYKVLTYVCLIPEILHSWVVDGKPFLNSCFLSLISIRRGCHCVFLMVLICSLTSIILNESVMDTKKDPALLTIHIWEMTVNGVTIITAFSFLYSYMWKKINFTLITIYWLLVVGIFHIGIFFSPKTFEDNKKIKLVHAINGFFFIYLAGIAVTYIQGFNLIQKLKREQLDGLEEWEDMELGDMLESELEVMEGGLMFPFVDLSDHLQNHKEAGMLDRMGREMW